MARETFLESIKAPTASIMLRTCCDIKDIPGLFTTRPDFPILYGMDKNRVKYTVDYGAYARTYEKRFMKIDSIRFIDDDMQFEAEVYRKGCGVQLFIYQRHSGAGQREICFGIPYGI